MPAISTKNDIDPQVPSICRRQTDSSTGKVTGLNAVRWIKAYYFFFYATDAVKLAGRGVFVANFGHCWSRKLELGDVGRSFSAI